MASTDLGQRMRAALEATIPDAEVAVRRVARRRSLRLARNHPVRSHTARSPASRHEVHASDWLTSIVTRKSVAVGGILAAALFAFAVAYGPWWSGAETESVNIGPSLARDLELRPRAPRPVDAPVSEQTPGPALPEAPPSQKSRPAARAPVPAAPAAASGDQEARWARVTEAMRKGDWEAAKVALAPLSASDDPETKDSARLLRIRIELGTSGSQTLEPRWQAELSELARSGSTSSIRASARRLLESSGSDSSGSDSSGSASSGSAPKSEDEGEGPQ